jgi:hypothetical protein
MWVTLAAEDGWTTVDGGVADESMIVDTMCGVIAPAALPVVE